MGAADRSILKTIDRALGLLEAFTIYKPEWGVTELSRHFGWDKSVVQRMLATLEARDFVTQDEETKRYRLGLTLLGLAEVVGRSLDVRELSKVTARRLVEQTSESVILTVVRGEEAVCIDTVDGTSAIKYSTHVGMRIPPHVGAGSKVLFAFRPVDELEAILGDRPLEKFTSSTIADKDELLREFGRIRERGIAISMGEMDPDVGAIGVPLRDHRGEIVAALTVVGPHSRIVAKQHHLEEKLREAQREISAKLGFRAQK